MTAMTEDEAKTKWCPFARARDQGFVGTGNAIIAAAINRVPDKEKTYEELLGCVGSRCMAWRWDWKANPNYPDGMSTSELPAIRDEKHGHCGLAGAP